MNTTTGDTPPTVMTLVDSTAGMAKKFFIENIGVDLVQNGS
jgi:hypothetical protein